jgi:hypothetical protein
VRAASAPSIRSPPVNVLEDEVGCDQRHDGVDVTGEERVAVAKTELESLIGSHAASV